MEQPIGCLLYMPVGAASTFSWKLYHVANKIRICGILPAQDRLCFKLEDEMSNACSV